jgi:hypothetical protein
MIKDYFSYDNILAYVGIGVSFWAVIQATKASTAAREARREVQLRSTEEEIISICNECVLKNETTWMEANNLVAKITGRVKSIIGQYESDINYKTVIDEINSGLVDLDIKFNSLDGETVKGSQICSTLASPFRKLIGSIQGFSGRLKDKAINK